jgi:hypothetical protein
VSSSSDVSFCDGNNAWPDSATYSTNCYTPINCQGVTSVIQQHSENKVLIKTIDLLGRETKQTNQPLFYIYDDGTVEKRIVIE